MGFWLFGVVAIYFFSIWFELFVVRIVGVYFVIYIVILGGG